MISVCGLQGCAASLHPIVDMGALVQEDSLSGTWVELNPITNDQDMDSLNTEGIFVVEKQDDGYELIVVLGKSLEGDSYQVYLFRMGEGLYVDMVFNWKQDVDGIFWIMSDVPAIPLHFLGRVERQSDTIAAFGLDPQWLEQSLRAGFLKLTHYGTPGEEESWNIVTSSSAEVREFMKQYGSDRKAFPLMGTFQRVKTH